MINPVYALASYILGSVPFAYILARMYGKDLTKFGDRNMGAANAYYATGRLWIGALATLLDAFKAFLPAYLWGPWYGVIAVLAHIFSIFGFTLTGRPISGAGTASSIGFALAVEPRLVPLAAAIFAAYYTVMRPGGGLMDFFEAERGYTAGMVMLWATYAISERLDWLNTDIRDALLVLVAIVSITYAYKLRYLFRKWRILGKR